MTACRKPAIRTQVHAHAEAAGSWTSCLVRLDLGLPFTTDVPNVDLPVVGGGREIGAIFTQCQRPRLAGLVGRCGDLAIRIPLASRLIQSPDFNLTAEACAGGNPPVLGGADVVAS